MVFKSDRQRKAVMARMNQGRWPGIQRVQAIEASSYITPGKKLGTFKNTSELFRQFPKEKQAFIRVMKFRQKTGIQVNTTKEIRSIQRSRKVNQTPKIVIGQGFLGTK